MNFQKINIRVVYRTIIKRSAILFLQTPQNLPVFCILFNGVDIFKLVIDSCNLASTSMKKFTLMIEILCAINQ